MNHWPHISQNNKDFRNNWTRYLVPLFIVPSCQSPFHRASVAPHQSSYINLYRLLIYKSLVYFRSASKNLFSSCCIRQFVFKIPSPIEVASESNIFKSSAESSGKYSSRNDGGHPGILAGGRVNDAFVTWSFCSMSLFGAGTLRLPPSPRLQRMNRRERVS